MSVKCEEPIDELTVQVWLLYHYPNFKYRTLFVSGTELQTNRQTNRQTDDPITRCPRRTFQAGGIKINRVHSLVVVNMSLKFYENAWNGFVSTVFTMSKSVGSTDSLTDGTTEALLYLLRNQLGGDSKMCLWITYSPSSNKVFSW